jgi:hypothetical protein
MLGMSFVNQIVTDDRFNAGGDEQKKQQKRFDKGLIAVGW